MGAVIALAMVAGGAAVAVLAPLDETEPTASATSPQSEDASSVWSPEEADRSGDVPRRVRKRVEMPPPRSRDAVLREAQTEAARAARQGLEELDGLRKLLVEAQSRWDAAPRVRVDVNAVRLVDTRHADGSPFRLGRLRNGERDGLWTERFASGARVETEYVNGKRHGHEAAWHPDGNPRFLGAYLQDEMHGTWTAWHENGQILSTREYVGDRLQGWMHTFHENGALAEASFFVDGAETGVNRGWHRNGQLAWEMEYRDGDREGPAIWYDEEGSLFAEGHYVADELHGRYVEYAPDGSVKRTERWDQGRRLAQAK